MNNETQQPQNIQAINEIAQSAENIITPEMLNNLRTLKSVADKDFKTIENLISIGGIKENDGQILKNEVLKKLFSAIKTTNTQTQSKSKEINADKNQENKANFGETAAKNNCQNSTADNNTSFDETISPKFATQNLETDAAKEITALGENYPTAKIIEFLTQTKSELTPQTVSELVKIVEANAIKEYLQKENLTQKQQAQNELAKQKLVSNVTQGKSGSNGANKIFTRESIKKMTPAEFKQYEGLIAKQIELGLLK